MKDVFARFSDDVNGEQSFTTSTCFDSTIDLRIHGRRWETYVCRQRVRNASLAIYVLRHTSSPALAPAAHPSPPGFSDPSRDPAGTTRPVRQILPFVLHHASGAARRTMPPPHRRTNARPFRSTVSAGSCHHRTGSPPDDTAPINRDSVSSLADTFFRNAPFSRSSGFHKKCP